MEGIPRVGRAAGGLVTVSLATGLLVNGATAWASASQVPAPAISATEKAAVVAWVMANEDSFTKLGSAFQAAGNAADNDQVPTLHKDCVGLEKVIVKVQKLAPIPDATIEALFKASLKNLMAGTVACVSGTTASGSLNPTLLKKASKDWETGGNQLLTVGNDLDKIVG